jgi:hypothetical protein
MFKVKKYTIILDDTTHEGVNIDQVQNNFLIDLFFTDQISVEKAITAMEWIRDVIKNGNDTKQRPSGVGIAHSRDPNDPGYHAFCVRIPREKESSIYFDVYTNYLN